MAKPKQIILSEEDRKELLQLYKVAEHTPMIGFSVQQMIEGRDFASLAWDRVRVKMDEVGKKYGFDPRNMKGINKETGEVVV